MNVITQCSSPYSYAELINLKKSTRPENGNLYAIFQASKTLCVEQGDMLDCNILGAIFFCLICNIFLQTGHLAMETLLSLTSKRAGDWFKEELRLLGGLDHIVDKGIQLSQRTC